MKLNSFLELLSGRLVQIRIDMLYDDAEGAFGWQHIRFSPELLGRLGFSETAVAADEAIRRARTHAAGTYWFEFERESHGMWHVYGRAGESVAIETTVGALRAILARESDARVERMRYEPMDGEITDVHELFFHKRREYRDEREIRSVAVYPRPIAQPVVEQRLTLDDLNRLIRRIILAPDSRPTFVEAMADIVDAVFTCGKKRFNGQITGSSLDENLVPQVPDRQRAAVQPVYEE